MEVYLQMLVRITHSEQGHGSWKAFTAQGNSGDN